MVKHIVFFKLVDASQANKNAVKERIMSLKGNIDELIHLEVGVNFSPEERAFDLALISDFKTKEDLQAYAIHPLHVKVVEFLKSIQTLSKIVDYEY
ncbi:Dabb family protein [Sulfurospirillum barnesii]|uniref:Stress responsive A/B Barrel Domain-containing protein n=1 Tax=Sulfurospirillum barnesii (strain ATCC 700032 / DSM 10660 / SES-3) TaxID=760154 RepID=I3Y0R9_SULBS|nr:Dabb family protein [Sulfurospirillum barnesii]AFL69793.1 Stress responsive A/B Barrel Domain-containing protein [Sulfurospirillum barnesii SES-3]